MATTIATVGPNRQLSSLAATWLGLAAELHAVVDQTMQPTTASLWLRPAPSTGATTPTGQPPQ